MLLGDDGLGHDGGDHRSEQHLGQFLYLAGGVGPSGPSADEQHRTLGVPQHLDRVKHAREVLVRRGHREVLLKLGRIDLSPENVHRKVDVNRALPSAVGDAHAALDRLRQIARLEHPVVMFGDRHHQAEDVRLLEGVVADGSGGHLAGEDHHR